MSALRVGVAVESARAVGVVLDAEETVLADAAVGPEPSAEPAELLARVVVRMVPEEDRGRVDRVVLADPGPLAALARPSVLPRVGVLRIGAPATTAVPPLTGWPDPLADAVRGPVAVVRGGHRYDGRTLAELDAEAVVAFGSACRGAVAAVAVNGVHAHMNPAHEREAGALLAELLGPDVPVLTGHDLAGTGLLERENTSVLGGAVAPQVQRFVEHAGAALAAAGVAGELYFMGGDGTVLPAASAVRHPLHLLGAGHAAAGAGAAALSDSRNLVVVEAGDAGVRISPRVLGVPVDSGALVDIAGVRTGLRRPRLVELCPPPRRVDAERLRREVTRAADEARGGPVVLAGERADTLPALAGRLPGGIEVLHPARARLAAAIGAAGGHAAGRVDRLFFFGPGGREDCVAEARRRAAELAIRAGADPRLLRIGEVREGVMTYVPVPCVRLRVTASGPLLAGEAPPGCGGGAR